MKEIEKASDTDRHQKGNGECSFAGVSNGVIYFSISHYNESKDCLEVVKICQVLC